MADPKKDKSWAVAASFYDRLFAALHSFTQRVKDTEKYQEMLGTEILRGADDALELARCLTNVARRHQGSATTSIEMMKAGNQMLKATLFSRRQENYRDMLTTCERRFDRELQSLLGTLSKEKEHSEEKFRTYVEKLDALLHKTRMNVEIGFQQLKIEQDLDRENLATERALQVDAGGAGSTLGSRGGALEGLSPKVDFEKIIDTFRLEI